MGAAVPVSGVRGGSVEQVMKTSFIGIHKTHDEECGLDMGMPVPAPAVARVAARI